MPDAVEVPAVVTYGVVAALVLGAGFVFNDWQSRATTNTMLEIYGTEEKKRNKYVSELAARMNLKLQTSTSLIGDELLLNKCINQKKLTEEAIRACFWEAKDRFELAEKHRERNEAQKKLDNAAIASIRVVNAPHPRVMLPK
jgi:hypothetical protein